MDKESQRRTLVKLIALLDEVIKERKRNVRRRTHLRVVK